MKINRFILAGLLAAASITGASAQTIHIIGSTAYRAGVNDAIRSILAPGYTWGTTAATTTNAALGGASTCIWNGTIKSGLTGAGTAIEIRTAFSGSIAGAADLAQGTQAKFIPHQTLSTAGTPNLSATELDTPDFAWTDTDVATDELVCKNAVSRAAYNALASAGLKEAGGAGSEGQGIVYFELVEEALTSGSTSPFTSISTDDLATLAQNGFISLAQLSGTDTANNESTYIVLTGRSEDSGSRANTFACAFEGATSSIGALTQQQYQPAYSGAFQTYSDNGAKEATGSATVEEGGTGSTLTSLALWPAGWGLNSDTTIYWAKAGLGGGFNSGGNLALALSATNPITTVSFTDPNSGNTATAVYLVTYLAGADAATCVAGEPTTLNTTNAQATRIAYNGVLYSQAAVLNGSYNIWGYEHAYYLPSATGVNKQAMDDIAVEVQTVTAEDDAFLDQNVTTDAAVGIFLPGGAEEVTRSSPGAPTTEDY
jgi:hypothetical protein